MSDDQSFYEIQLNAPHLVLAFLGAVIVGVTVFWLGVVVGRGQTGTGLSEDWQAAAPAEGSDAESYEFYDAVNEPAAQPQAAEMPPAEAAPEPEANQPSPAGTPQFTPADPVDEQRAPVVVESPAGLPQPDASLPSGWIVQVRSTPDKPDADSLQSALVAASFPAFVVSAEVDGVTYYRVRVGRYRSKGEADIIEAELVSRSDIETTWVTEG